MLDKVINVLSGSGSDAGNPPGFLGPIDTDRLAKTLDVDKSGCENGRNGSPRHDATIPDAVEQQVIQRIEGEWSTQGIALVDTLRAYGDRLIGYSIDSEFQRLQLRARDTLTKLRAAHHIAEQKLGPLRDVFIDTRSEYSLFRSEHGLHRPARDKSRRWISFGILTLLVGFESVLNGVFFAKGSSFGLVGGIGTAIGISLVNVIVAFLVGLGPLRWMHHKNAVLKLIGFVTSVAAVAGLVLLHAFAAHLREATAGVGEALAMKTAIDTLLHTPWSLTDLASVYLFGLGLLFALGALWKGYTFDDPYPFYGAQWRRLERARGLYADEHSELFDELESIKIETVTDLDSGIARIPKFPQEAAAIRAQRSALLQNFKTYEATVESAVNTLLARYRDANRRCRTEPAPSYFDHVWRLPHSILDSAQVQQLIADPIQPNPDVPTALEELRRLAKEILEEYESLIKQYPHTTQIQ